MTTVSWVHHWLARSRSGGVCGDPPTRVGRLDLADHQARAVGRGTEIARRYGGVLIADAVGLGKTRVGLGVARAVVREERRLGADERRLPVWVCAPARLREDWEESLKAARLDGEVVSHTQLSREGESLVAGRPGAMIVDEAHRFRNPSAERSATLARLAERTPLVLVTATPVCNDVWDLYHLLTYFLAEDDLREVIGYDLQEGFERAERGDWDLSELLERIAIRRRDIEGWSNRPTVRLEKLTYEPGEAELWVWKHLEARLRELSMAAFDGDWPKGLFVEHVRKRWESAPQAARRTLRRVALFHRRWLQAAARGHRLVRPEYKRWFGRQERQEAMPFVLDGTVCGQKHGHSTGGVSDEVVASVRRDLAIIEELVDRIDRALREECGAAQAVADLVAETAGKVLVFCEYYRTAETYYRTLVSRLGPVGRVGLVTGEIAKATGLGRTNSREIRARFAPTASGSGYADAHQQLEVLVATDCLAEGVNLQDCGRLVLADMPYSPLRIEQRVGRLVRPGSPHADVEVYLPEPDTWVETLGLQSRVSEKIEQARRVGSQPAAAASVTTSPDNEYEVGADRWSPVGPMEAVTRLDALYQRLSVRTGGHRGEAESVRVSNEADWWTEREPTPGSADACDPPEAWVRWCIRSCPDEPVEGEAGEESTEVWGWARIRSGEVTLRRSHLVKPLTAVAQSERLLERCEPRSGLLEPLQRWLEHRVSTLTSASLAPAPISMDDPQWKLWARVRDAAAEGRLDGDRQVLEEVRKTLLRSRPQGRRRRFERWWETDPSPTAILEGTCKMKAVANDRGVDRWKAEIRSVMLIREPPGPPASVG